MAQPAELEFVCRNWQSLDEAGKSPALSLLYGVALLPMDFADGGSAEPELSASSSGKLQGLRWHNLKPLPGYDDDGYEEESDLFSHLLTRPIWSYYAGNAGLAGGRVRFRRSALPAPTGYARYLALGILSTPSTAAVNDAEARSLLASLHGVQVRAGTGGLPETIGSFSFIAGGVPDHPWHAPIWTPGRYGVTSTLRLKDLELMRRGQAAAQRVLDLDNASGGRFDASRARNPDS